MIRQLLLRCRYPHVIRTLNAIKPYSSEATTSTSPENIRKYIGLTAVIAASSAATYFSFPLTYDKHKKAVPFRYAPLPLEELHTVSNWSGTHEVHTRTFLQPESIEELEKIVSDAANGKEKMKLRPVGSGLSPNGIKLQRKGMVNLALMDRILSVDKKKKRVTVEVGIRVAGLVDGLKEYGLTLQNFASIREQQVGGIIQEMVI